MIKANPAKLLFVLIILIAIFSTLDVFIDLENHQSVQHISIESALILGCIFCLLLIKEFFYTVQYENISLKSDLSKSKKEFVEWKENAALHIKGLSEQIDLQFLKWNLSPAEDEIARLLLKGLSLKEIADIRGTSERTIRQQTVSVYSKSNLSGRAELSAFFLEDLLFPSKGQKTNVANVDKANQNKG